MPSLRYQRFSLLIPRISGDTCNSVTMRSVTTWATWPQRGWSFWGKPLTAWWKWPPTWQMKNVSVRLCDHFFFTYLGWRSQVKNKYIRGSITTVKNFKNFQWRWTISCVEGVHSCTDFYKTILVRKSHQDVSWILNLNHAMTSQANKCPLKASVTVPQSVYFNELKLTATPTDNLLRASQCSGPQIPDQIKT